MRPIDADALAETFSELEAKNRKALSFTRAADFRRARALTNMAPTIGFSTQWIPCSERMPEPDTYVLALLRDGEMCTVRLYDDGCWIGCRGFAPSEAVTHWMPLPEPPKGGAYNA